MSNLVGPATLPPADAAEHDPFAGPAIANVVPTTEPQRECGRRPRSATTRRCRTTRGSLCGCPGRSTSTRCAPAFDAVVARHEALRSTFSADGLTMLIAAEAAIPVEIVDVAGRAADSIRGDWDALLAREASERFNLSNGPVARVKVFRIGPEEHRVVFTAHHIVDGWSTAVVVREWAALYSGSPGRRGGPRSPRPTRSAPMPAKRRPPLRTDSAPRPTTRPTGSLAMSTTCPSSSCRSIGRGRR